MNFVPCATWIRRGVSKEVPDKISLTKADWDRLVIGAKNKDSDDEDDDNTSVDEVTKSRSSAGLADDDFNQYGLDDYDEDEASYGPKMTDIVSFGNKDEEDPYLILKEEDDNSDDEDFQIKPTDNIIACGVASNEEYTLQFHVYNEDEGSFYVHHDITLNNIPLCMEWLNHSPTEEPNNFIAVGGMSSAIEIWDVDIVDCLEPVVKLVNKPKKKLKAGKESTKRRNKDEDGSPDAILDLAWNPNFSHILASGSSNCSVAFWDLDESELAFSITDYQDKVQSLKWHPYEPFYLLTGSTDNYARLVDCRDTTTFAKSWKCDGEVEKVIWDQFNPFNCLAATDKGFVHCFDARTDKPLWNLSAHTSECSGLAISSECPGFMLTSSLDKSVKVWDILGVQPSCVHELKMSIGRLCCLAASPDSPFIAFVGGDNRSDNSKVVDFTDYSAVSKTFIKRMNRIRAESAASVQPETSVPKKKKVKKLTKKTKKKKVKSSEPMDL